MLATIFISFDNDTKAHQTEKYTRLIIIQANLAATMNISLCMIASTNKWLELTTESNSSSHLFIRMQLLLLLLKTSVIMKQMLL